MPDEQQATHHDLVLDALRRGAADEALAAGHAAVAAAPDDATAHRLLSAALRLNGDDAAALASLDRAIELAPEEAALHLERGQLLAGARQLDQAQAALAQSIGLDPNQFPAYILQAQLAMARNDVDEAERLGKLAARVAPQHPHVQAIEGAVALARGQNMDAVSILSEAAAQHPDDAQLLHSLAFAHLAEGNLAFAEQALRRAAEQLPEQASLRALIAQLLLRQGLPAETLAELQPLLEADPVAPAVSRLAGESYLSMSQPEQAIVHLRAALEGQPGNRRTLLVALEAWQRMNARGDAQAALDALTGKAPQIDDLWRARLSLEATGSAPARAIVERWLQARPEHVPALEAAMAMHAIEGDRPAVTAMAERIIAIDPGHVEAQLRRVETLQDSDPSAALARLKQLWADAGSAEARQPLRYPLALALDRAGDAEAALATWLAATGTGARPDAGNGSAAGMPSQWPGLGSELGRSGDAEAALATWQTKQADASVGVPPPPPCPPRTQWPELGQADAGSAAIGLLWGAPGSVVEDVVVAGMAMRLPFLSDRFSPQPPQDALQLPDTAARLASGQLDPASVVTGWRDALAERGVAERGFVDWLPWWDNQLLLALRPHLPGALLLIALRDPRDMLLDWLAFGTPSNLLFETPKAAASWLAEVLEQIATLHEQDLFNHQLLRLDHALDEPPALAGVINQALQTQLPPPPRAALGPQRLAAGRWRHYDGVLGEAFALLTPVAGRLGYVA